MPTLAGPAIDPTPIPARAVVSAGTITAPLPPPPEPPGAETEWTGAPIRRAPLVQVMLGRAITRTVIGELVTAVADDWDYDVELLAGSTASITASAWDPLWEACAETVTMGADGLPKYTFDPGGFVVWIYLDGAAVWTGRFTQPIDFGDGTVGLLAQGPQSVFDERILGRAEQLDLLGDRGSFEVYANEAAMVADGWSFPDGMLFELVDDFVRGSQSLRVKGEGWFRSPKVTRMGADGYGRAIQGATFGRWNNDAPTGTAVVRTYVQRTDSLAPSNQDVTEANQGLRPDSGQRWTEEPVESATRMSSQAVPHRCWVEGRGYGGLWSYYDLMTLRESTQTGFPPGSYRDLSEYVVRILRDLHAADLGGSPTGLTSVIKAYTGVETSQRWSHAQQTTVRDVLSVILDRDDGPECRITPDWVLEIWDRLGSPNPHIALSVHDILRPNWAIDPGNRITDYVAGTGRGSGANWIGATVSQPVVENQWRRVRIVPGPVDRSFNEIEAWALAHARALARLQVTAEVEVPWHVGEQLKVGDTPMVTQHDGHLSPGENRMRVLRIRCKPETVTMILTLGATD